MLALYKLFIKMLVGRASSLKPYRVKIYRRDRWYYNLFCIFLL